MVSRLCASFSMAYMLKAFTPSTLLKVRMQAAPIARSAMRIMLTTLLRGSSFIPVSQISCKAGRWHQRDSLACPAQRCLLAAAFAKLYHEPGGKQPGIQLGQSTRQRRCRSTNDQVRTSTFWASTRIQPACNTLVPRDDHQTLSYNCTCQDTPHSYMKWQQH